MSSIDIKVIFKKEYDLKVQITELDSIKDKLMFAKGIYTFWDREGNALYVGISTDLSRRIFSYIGVNPISASKINADIVEFLKVSEGAYLSVIFEEEAWKRDVAETVLIKDLDPRFNKAKKEDGLSVNDYLLEAKEIAKKAYNIKRSELRTELIKKFDVVEIDNLMAKKSFCGRINVFSLGDVLIYKDYLYEETLKSVNKELEHSPEVNLEKCVPYGMYKRIINSIVFRDFLRKNGIIHIGGGVVSRIEDQSA